MNADFREDFEYLVEAFLSGYIFLDAKTGLLGEPFARTADRFRTRLYDVATREAFWGLLSEMLKLLRDGHTGMEVPQERWAPKTDRPPHIDQDVISLHWVSSEPLLAHLPVRDFAVSKEDWQPQAERLDAICAEIAKAQGVILDFRHCGGGTPTPCFDLVSRFIDRPVLNFERRWLVSDIFLRYHDYAYRFRDKTGLSLWESDGGPGRATIQPSERPGLRSGVPVLLLVGPHTVSRGEELPLILAEEGFGVLVGQPTAGACACPLHFPLPNTGWKVRMSVGEVRSGRGYVIEGQGLPLRARLEEMGAGPTQLADSIPDSAVEYLKSMMA